jgi:hypothetical protein
MQELKEALDLENRVREISQFLTSGLLRAAAVIPVLVAVSSKAWVKSARTRIRKARKAAAANTIPI